MVFLFVGGKNTLGFLCFLASILKDAFGVSFVVFKHLVMIASLYCAATGSISMGRMYDIPDLDSWTATPLCCVLLCDSEDEKRVIRSTLLLKDGDSLGVLPCLQSPSLPRAARLSLSASSVGFIATKIEWLFLGVSPEGVEIWGVVPALWMGESSPQLVEISHDDIHSCLSRPAQGEGPCVIKRKDGQEWVIKEPWLVKMLDVLLGDLEPFR